MSKEKFQMVAPNIERRVFDASELRVERRGEGDAPTIVGYAALFDTLSENLGGFREKIDRGAFAKSLQGDVRALINHDANLVLGRTNAGTLRLTEDERGLSIEIDPPDTTFAKDLMTTIERGDISQQSFGFRTIKDAWETVEEGPDIRTLVEVELFDIGPVTFPAYPDTAVAVRSLEAWQEQQIPTGPDPAIEIHRRRMQRLAV